MKRGARERDEDEQSPRPALCHARQRAHEGGGSGGLREGNGLRSTGEIGTRFEARALAYLRVRRLVLVARNVRCRGGELDLVMRDADGTLVFVEVRARTSSRYGGAAASVGWHKQRRLLCAARYFLATHAGRVPACRFDVVAFEGERVVWLRDAFRADGS